MKISKNLLKQISLGLCFAGAITACGINDEDPLSEEHEICTEADKANDGETKSDWGDCPACGMG